MNKKKGLILLIAIILAAIAVPLKINHDFRLADPIIIPSDIDRVIVEHDKTEVETTESEWITRLTELLESAEPTRKQSVNDSPSVGGWYMLSLASESEGSRLFVYEEGNYPDDIDIFITKKEQIDN